MKKLVLAFLVVCLCLVCLTGCIEKAPTADEAITMGTEMYDKALAMSDREKYEFEAYEFGLLKLYEQNEIYYYCVTNFFDFDVDIMSTEAMVKLKEKMGLLLTAEKTAFIPVEYTESLFAGTYTLFVTEREVDRIVYKVYTQSYATAEEKAAGERPSVTNISEFSLARSYLDVEGEDGKTVREYYWYVLDYDSPF